MVSALCLCVLYWGTLVLADETGSEAIPTNVQAIVRARIGIELRAGDEKRHARKYERVLAGDLFRIYAIPEPEPAYIYGVYSDQKTAERLNESERTKIPKDDTLIIPSPEELYEFEHSSTSVFVTVICSATELPEIDALLNGQDPSHAKWLISRIVALNPDNLPEEWDGSIELTSK